MWNRHVAGATKEVAQQKVLVRKKCVWSTLEKQFYLTENLFGGQKSGLWWGLGLGLWYSIS